METCAYCGCDIIKDDIPFGEMLPDGTIEMYHGICLDNAGDDLIEQMGDGGFAEYTYDYDKNGTPPHPGWIAPTL